MHCSSKKQPVYSVRQYYCDLYCDCKELSALFKYVLVYAWNQLVYMKISTY